MRKLHDKTIGGGAHLAQMNDKSSLALLILASIISLSPALATFMYPPVLKFPLMHGEHLMQWRRQWLGLGWIVLSLLYLLASVCARIMFRRLRKEASVKISTFSRILEPIAFAPALSALSMSSLLLGATLAGMALPLGIPLLLACSLERAFGSLEQKSSENKIWRPRYRGFILYAVFLLLLGLAFNSRFGEHIGDEGHYITQLTSLMSDGDLAVENNLPQPLPEAGPARSAALLHSHLVENTETGHCYSYHSFGLPLLALPFGFLGFFGRQLFLAIVGALSLAGCLSLCSALGSPGRASAAAVASLGASYVWIVYSIRFLPEILGCGLLAWGFFGFVTRHRHPRLSMATTLICCGLLPYAHTRFAFPSLTLAFLYGLDTLLYERNSAAKFGRLAVFTLGYALFGITLVLAQSRMFASGNAYPTFFKDVLWSYPLGMWAIIADKRGLLPHTPVLAVYLVAGAAALLYSRKHRKACLAGALVALSVLVTACTNTSALDGQCVPGRYFLTVIPLFVPPAAWLLAKSGRAGRIWFYFLSSISATLLTVIAFTPKMRGPSFVQPLSRVVNIEGLHALFSPFPSFIQPEFATAPLWGSAFVIGLFLATFIAMRRVGRYATIAACFSVLIAVRGGWKVHSAEWTSDKTLTNLLRRDVFKRAFIRVPKSAPDRDLFDSFGSLEFTGHRTPQTLSNSSSSKLRIGDSWYLGNLQVNDWAGRDYRWWAMHTPLRQNINGGIALRAVGEAQGRTRPAFAIRQGPYTLYEEPALSENGPFDVVWLLETRRGRGDILPLLRLEGEGHDVLLNTLQVAPYSPSLTKGGRFYFKGETRLPSDDVIYAP